MRCASLEWRMQIDLHASIAMDDAMLARAMRIGSKVRRANHRTDEKEHRLILASLHSRSECRRPEGSAEHVVASAGTHVGLACPTAHRWRRPVRAGENAGEYTRGLSPNAAMGDRPSRRQHAYFSVYFGAPARSIAVWMSGRPRE